MFDEIGQVASSMTYVHLEFPLDLETVNTGLDKILEMRDKLYGILHNKDKCPWEKCMGIRNLPALITRAVNRIRSRLHRYENLVISDPGSPGKVSYEDIP
jgi:hypothetical protein